jgi:hypothetical protein
MSRFWTYRGRLVTCYLLPTMRSYSADGLHEKLKLNKQLQLFGENHGFILWGP